MVFIPGINKRRRIVWYCWLCGRSFKPGDIRYKVCIILDDASKKIYLCERCRQIFPVEKLKRHGFKIYFRKMKPAPQSVVSVSSKIRSH